MKTARDRLMAHIHMDGSGCWLWRGCVTDEGYGMFRMKDASGKHRTFKAHRAAYELFGETIVPGAQLDHLCHVRNCVNPGHLRPATARENTSNRRGKLAGRYSSRFVGVSWAKTRGKWLACIWVNGRHTNLGCFETEEEAASTYRAALEGASLEDR